MNESIYSFVLEHTTDNRYDGAILPDDFKIQEKSKLKGIRLAPGLLDDFQASTQDQGQVKKICDLLELISTGTDKRADLYAELVSGENAISIVDSVLKELAERKVDITESLQILAQWLMRESSDREPVKFGITLCGVVGGVVEPVVLFANCEEFALFSGLALIKRANADIKIEEVLIEIASKLEGWGKIQLVRIMTEYLDIKNRQWFLYEGWKNIIGPEVTLRCAIAGKLDQEVDTADIEKITKLVEDLIPDFRSQGSLDSYEHAASVLKKVIERLSKEDLKIEYLLFASRVLEYVSNKEIDNESKKLGWNEEVKNEIIEVYKEFTDRKEWADITKAAIEGDDIELANRVAYILRLDVWDKNYEHLISHPKEAKERGHVWFNLMRSNSKERADKVVNYALAILPLKEYCTGPDIKTMFMPGFNFGVSQSLSAILQIIQPFSGLGYDLVSKSLYSPVIVDRNMTFNVLEEWHVEDLKRHKIAELLQDLLEKEPDEQVRERTKNLLSKIEG